MSSNCSDRSLLTERACKERWDKILELVTVLVLQTLLYKGNWNCGISTHLIPALPPIFVLPRKRKMQQMSLPEAFKGRKLCHAVDFAPFELKQKKISLQGCQVVG